MVRFVSIVLVDAILQDLSPTIVVVFVKILSPTLQTVEAATTLVAAGRSVRLETVWTTVLQANRLVRADVSTSKIVSLTAVLVGLCVQVRADVVVVPVATWPQTTITAVLAERSVQVGKFA